MLHSDGHVTDVLWSPAQGEPFPMVPCTSPSSTCLEPCHSRSQQAKRANHEFGGAGAVHNLQLLVVIMSYLLNEGSPCQLFQHHPPHLDNASSCNHQKHLCLANTCPDHLVYLEEQLVEGRNGDHPRPS